MLPLLTIWCVMVPVLSFNLAPEHAKIFSDPAGTTNSYFGFSVALLGGRDPRLVVGAPQAHSPETYSALNARRLGAVYTCPVNHSKFCKQILPGDPKDFQELTNTADIYLGGSLDAEENGSGLVACAPRWNPWFHTNCSDVGCLFGLCYFMQNASNEKDSVKLDQEVSASEYYDGRKRYMIHRQAGMSAQLIPDHMEIFVGAVGIDGGNGGVMKFQDESNKNVSTYLSPYHKEAEIADSYFGYSVTSGNLLKDKTLYVAGAPRGGDYRGEVFIFDIGDHDLDVVQQIQGRQLGEYFGAALCVVDLNRDGLDDLLVGAPQHSSTSSWDTGVVYVFINNIKNGLQEKFKISGADDPGSRFGMTISALGDLNKDGYMDVAVGAPYDSGGQGAIYIYHGSKNGVNPRYRQRLTVSYSRGFGYSISRGVDTDQNRYNDIAVGAYGSSQAFLIRSYPVVTVHPRVTTNVSKITPTTTNIVVTSCISYKPAAEPASKLRPLDVLAKVQVDQKYKRGKILTENNQYLESLPGTGKEVCRNFTVFIEPPNGKHYDNRPIRISVTCKVKPHLREEFCKQCPVVDPDLPMNYQLNVPIDLLCGDRAECSPDLVLQATFVDVTSPFTIDSSDTVRIMISVENKGEPAYDSRLHISISKVCHFRKLPAECHLAAGSQLQCEFDKPVLAGDKYILDLELDVSNLPTSMSLLLMNISAESRGAEKNDANNHVVLALPVQADVDILTRGTSQPAVVIYHEDTVKQGDDIVSHVYQVQNFGVTSAQEMEVQVRIPILACVKKIPVKLLELNSSQITTDGPTLKCSVIDTNSLTSCPDDTTEPTGVLPLSCDMAHVQCSNVLCSGGLLLSFQQQTFNISFKPHIWEARKHFGKKRIILYSSAETIFNSSEGRVVAEATVSTVFHWQEEYRVDTWVIVVSVLGGLILLLFISFILYKLGFFQRKVMESQETLLNENGTPTE